jgi:hypothetical protein
MSLSEEQTALVDEATEALVHMPREWPYHLDWRPASVGIREDDSLVVVFTSAGFGFRLTYSQGAGFSTRPIPPTAPDPNTYLKDVTTIP